MRFGTNHPFRSLPFGSLAGASRLAFLDLPSNCLKLVNLLQSEFEGLLLLDYVQMFADTGVFARKAFDFAVGEVAA